MNSDIEKILEQTKQLKPQDQIELIDRLTSLNKAESEHNPWLAIAGSLDDDPFFEDYMAEIEKYREEIDRQESDDKNSNAA
jgi:hypothetical protein